MCALYFRIQNDIPLTVVFRFHKPYDPVFKVNIFLFYAECLINSGSTAVQEPEQDRELDCIHPAPPRSISVNVMEIPEDFIIRINMGLEIRCPEEYVMHKVYAVSF